MAVLDQEEKMKIAPITVIWPFLENSTSMEGCVYIDEVARSVDIGNTR